MQFAGPVGGGVWCRKVVGDRDGCRWYVDAWVAPHRGRLVVGELRLAPAVPAARKPGQPWPLDPQLLPRHGLDRRLLEAARIGRIVPEVMAKLHDAAAFLDAGPGPREGTVEHMVLTFLLNAVPGLAGLVSRPRPRRNVGRDDVFYARLAAEYVERIRTGSTSPVKDIAARRGDTPAHIRDLLHEARERGLLTRGVAGKSEGALTPRAVALLGGAPWNAASGPWTTSKRTTSSIRGPRRPKRTGGK